MEITQKQTIRQLVRGIYDLQTLRIQIGNRVAAAFRVKLGIKSSEDEKKADKEKLELLNRLRREYRRVTDGIVGTPTLRNFEPIPDGIIDTYSELMLVRSYIVILDDEEMQFNRLEYSLRGIPIYDLYLKNVVGIGPALSGVIISEFDIHKAEYPSSLICYAGLDCVRNDETGQWEGRSKRKQHLVEQEYIDGDGEVQTKMGISYNPFLKSKLIGVAGPSFLKQGDKSIYQKIYRNYRHRIENMPQHQDKTALHIHKMAIRYAVKRFLTDLYAAWRKIEGLPVAAEYSEAKLGIYHKIAQDLENAA